MIASRRRLQGKHTGSLLLLVGELILVQVLFLLLGSLQGLDLATWIVVNEVLMSSGTGGCHTPSLLAPPIFAGMELLKGLRLERKEKVGVCRKGEKKKKPPDTYQTEGWSTAYLIRANAEPVPIRREIPASHLAL